MQFLKELLIEAKAHKVSKVPKKAVRAVYRRDYLKTKHKHYRKYNKRKHLRVKRSYVKENLDGHDVNKATSMLGQRDPTEQNLRHDLHLIRLIKYETHPTEMEVFKVTDVKHAVRFFYPVDKVRKTFTRFTGMFGNPVSRSHKDGEVSAIFFDTLTKTRVMLSYNSHDRYLVSQFVLKTNKTQTPEVKEYYILQLKNFAQLLNEGTLQEQMPSHMLADPLSQKARPMINDPLSSEMVYLRNMVIQYLRADESDWKFINDAISIDEATMRVMITIEQLVASSGLKLSTAAKKKVAEEIARDYWRQDI